MPTISPDSEGYFRRRCGACRRDFAARLDPYLGADTFWCPYCASQHSWDCWFTPAQQAYIEDELAEAALGIVSEQIDDALADLASVSEGMLEYRSSGDNYQPRQAPPESTDDLVERELPCHPEARLKIESNWMEIVRCHLCGSEPPQPTPPLAPTTRSPSIQ